MNAKNPSWSNGPNLPYSARHGVMYTIGDHLYMLGGYQYDSSCYACCRNYHYRIAETDSSWSSRSILQIFTQILISSLQPTFRAGFHINIMQTTAVVDRDTERAYILGGHDCSYHRAEVRVYLPSSNSWTYISNLPFSSRGVAAAIIRQKNDEKWIMALRNAHTFVFYQVFKQSSMNKDLSSLS